MTLNLITAFVKLISECEYIYLILPAALFSGVYSASN
jgi:hypothetical protein